MDSKVSAADEHQKCTEQVAQLEQLAAQLRPIFEKHHVLRAIVFGSLARGELHAVAMSTCLSYSTQTSDFWSAMMVSCVT